ncbi:LytR/AlgR family response regulator transcription factor [Metabacillus idriensis]|uniref:LytR/AlgR family response regulator transcription factor n=1 Tax=Metabacillus idriensis TaxID=324768 RepID=UPI00163AF474|nr:LytTR family transcriptional regulator DNA-binding domain-containing protein [Metabacillus idriensis]QNG60765.1 LytTR family transcriptional regulator DNA-binding domain-containing protein [Bacillus sp. PAMC26568]
MLKAFIVDDEPLARDELKYLLLRSKRVEIVGEADCIEDAIQQIPDRKPHLVFLDIELAEDSGLQLAEQIRALEPAPAIIFATAYDEYALKAFELNAVDYILKPFDEMRIQQTLDKISSLKSIGGIDAQSISRSYKMAGEQTGKIALLVEERIVLVDIPTIVYVGSAEGKTIIKTIELEYKTGDPLVTVEKKLNPDAFLRVHRSFLVNMHHISEIEPWFNSTYNLIMKDGSKIPVSRTYVKELKQRLGF